MATQGPERYRRERLVVGKKDVFGGVRDISQGGGRFGSRHAAAAPGAARLSTTE